jgi:hypothetical protein
MFGNFPYSFIQPFSVGCQLHNLDRTEPLGYIRCRKPNGLNLPTALEPVNYALRSRAALPVGEFASPSPFFVAIMQVVFNISPVYGWTHSRRRAQGK